jgi:hypothetical protein
MERCVRLRAIGAEPRLEFKMTPEPNDALIRAVIDEWIVPAMVDQFLTLNGDIRARSIRPSDAEHSVFMGVRIST